MPVILNFEAVHQLETFISEFYDPEFLNLDPHIAILSSIEAEIFAFLFKKGEYLVVCLLHPSYEYFYVPPLQELKVNAVFICSVIVTQITDILKRNILETLLLC